MEFKDYYKILDVNRDADIKTIKQAYRRLARKYHPDVSKEENAEAQFKAVLEAYDVLRDSEKRKAYDQFGENWKAGMQSSDKAGAQGGVYSENIRPEDVAEFSDLFNTIFADRATRGRWQASWRGQDVHAQISITLDEAYHGCAKTLTFETWEQDDNGQPRSRVRNLKTRIPAGVTDGQRIRLTGQGQPGVGENAAGDLYLQINIKPHPNYKVIKRDLYMNVPITPWEAALGEKITVPTIAGLMKLTIPPGTQTGKQLKLKGKGLPGKLPGDLYAVINIIVPTPRNIADEDLYKKMEEAMPLNPRANMGV